MLEAPGGAKRAANGRRRAAQGIQNEGPGPSGPRRKRGYGKIRRHAFGLIICYAGATVAPTAVHSFRPAPAHYCKDSPAPLRLLHIFVVFRTPPLRGRPGKSSERWFLTLKVYNSLTGRNVPNQNGHLSGGSCQAFPPSDDCMPSRGLASSSLRGLWAPFFSQRPMQSYAVYRERAAGPSTNAGPDSFNTTQVSAFDGPAWSCNSSRFFVEGLAVTTKGSRYTSFVYSHVPPGEVANVRASSS